MKLNVRQVGTAKPKDKVFKLSDGGGLYLLVNPNGKRYWRLKYRVAGKWLLLHNTHAQQMSDSIDAMASNVKSLGKVLQRLRSEQGLLAGSEESAAMPTKMLVALAAVEKEFAGKVKKLTQRYANYDFYLQGNGHLGWSSMLALGQNRWRYLFRQTGFNLVLNSLSLSHHEISQRFQIEGGNLQGYR